VIINPHFDSSITESPLAASIESAIFDAISFFQAEFTSPVATTIDFGFGEVDNQPLESSAAAENVGLGSFVSYSTLETALSAHDISLGGITTPLQSILPSPADVPQGAEFWLTYADQKALGILAANSNEVDGYVGISDALDWAWNQNVVSGSGQSDAVGAVEHEISEVMGRVGYLGEANPLNPPVPNDYGPADLYRFSSSGVREFTQGDGFFSLNDGKILLMQFNNPLDGGDAADWYPAIAGDSFGDIYPGVGSVITATDLEIMQALGWTQSSLPDVTVNNVVTNVTSVGQTGTLKVTYDLDNIGTAPIAATTAYIYLYTSPSSLTATGVLIGTLSQPMLIEQSTTPVSAQVAIPQNLAPGVYYVGVEVNPKLDVPESDYSNDYSSDVVPLVVTPQSAPVNNLTGGGTSDVLLRNGGTVVAWIIQKGQYEKGNILTTAAAGWNVVGTGDFSGNGTDDVLLQNGGTVADWIMQNGQYESGNILTTAAAGWNVVGTGDFTGNGTDDVLLQNGGTVADWIIKEGAYQSGNVLTTGATGWKVVGTGDFTGTGTDDALLQNGGTIVDWIMKDGAYQSGNVLTTGAAGWAVVGAGDYNGDGTSDVLLQNGGTVVDWIMKDGAYQSGNVLTTAAAGWHVGTTQVAAGPETMTPMTTPMMAPMGGGY
jgi:hypothetical protein